MATINKRIAEQIIANNGHFADDPQVQRVVRYTNMWGGESWAIIYPHQDPEMYHKSPACRNVTVVWEAKPTP